MSGGATVRVLVLGWVAWSAGAGSGCIRERCYASADCPAPQVCSVEGTCVFECTRDGDCGAGFACREHGCVPSAAVPDVQGDTDSGDVLPPVPGCSADMALVSDSYCVDRFEASRPDATPASEGGDGSQARSVAGVLPWRVADNATAQAACVAAGKRLCTPAEWEWACRGPAGTIYGYGDEYQPQTCNGIDTFGTTGFHLLPTGSLPGCTNGFGVYDMNGNLWEHTAGGSDTVVRGGAFNCSDSRTFHRCDYVPGTWTPSAKGFRCCADPQ